MFMLQRLIEMVTVKDDILSSYTLKLRTLRSWYRIRVFFYCIQFYVYFGFLIALYNCYNIC